MILYFSKSIAMPSQRMPSFQENSKQCCSFCPRLPCILAPQKSFSFSGGFDVSINCIYVGLNLCLHVGISLRHFTVLISLFHRQGTSWRILCLLPDRFPSGLGDLGQQVSLAYDCEWSIYPDYRTWLCFYSSVTWKSYNSMQLCVCLGFGVFFLRITNQNEGHVSLILPKAGGTKYNFNWFQLIIWLCLIEAMLLLHQGWKLSYF